MRKTIGSKRVTAILRSHLNSASLRLRLRAVDSSAATFYFDLRLIGVTFAPARKPSR